MLDGIDVSHHNTVTDWPAVYLSGARFAYVKVSEGTWYTDQAAGAHAAGAAQAGLRVGGYHFARPGDVAGQVALFARELTALGLLGPGALWPALDMEDLKLRPDADAFVAAFRDALRSVSGVRGLVVYANRNWFTKILSPDLWADDGVLLWVARYHDDPVSPGWAHPRAALYQWTNTGVVDGVNDHVDRDVLLPGWDLDAVTILPVAPDPDGYVVRPGDTLSGIAERWFGDAGRWREIYAANRAVITDPDVIQIGWVLTLPHPTTAPPVPWRTYSVRPGDMLSLIALNLLGDASRFTEIVALNPNVIKDPSKIRPGWVLRIPNELPPSVGEAGSTLGAMIRGMGAGHRGGSTGYGRRGPSKSCGGGWGCVGGVAGRGPGHGRCVRVRAGARVPHRARVPVVRAESS